MTLDVFLRRFAIGTLFAVLFVPLVVTESLFFPFITGKNFLFRILVEVGLAAWLVLLLRGQVVIPRSPILWAFVAFIGVMGIANIFGADPSRSFWSNYERMEGYVTLLHLFGYFVMAISLLRTERLWERFLLTSLGVSAIVVGYSFIQLAGGFDIHQGATRVDATLGNATYLAIYTIFHIFIAAFLAIRKKGKGWSFGERIAISSFGTAILFLIFGGSFEVIMDSTGRITEIILEHKWILINGLIALGVAAFLSLRSSAFLLGTLAVGHAVVLYFTATRGSILGFIGGALIAALLTAFFARLPAAPRTKTNAAQVGHNKTVRRVSFGALALVLVVIGGFFALKDTSVVRENPVLNRFATISLEERTTEARFIVWGMALESVKEQPFLGTGQENFNLIFNKKYDPRLYNQEPFFDRAHNVFLDWLTAGGVLGLLAYLSLFATAMWLLWSRRLPAGLPARGAQAGASAQAGGSEVFTRVEQSLFTGLGAAYFFHNLFVFDNLVSYVMFFSVLAFIAAVAGGGKEFSLGDRFRGSGAQAMRFAGYSVIVIALIFTMYAVNIKGIMASYHLIEGMKPRQDLNVNIEHFKTALSYESFGSGEIRERLVQSAGQLAGVQQVPEGIRSEFVSLAREEMEKQIAEHPEDARYEIIYGSFLSQVGDRAGALAHMKRALELSPNKQAIMFEIVSLHLNRDEFNQALAMAQKAYELAPEYSEARRIYALAAIYDGQKERAQEILGDDYEEMLLTDDQFTRAFSTQEDFEMLIWIWESRLDHAREQGTVTVQMHFNLAASYLGAERRQDAVEQLQQARALDPQAAEQIDYYISEIRAGRNP